MKAAEEDRAASDCVRKYRTAPEVAEYHKGRAQALGDVAVWLAAGLHWHVASVCRHCVEAEREVQEQRPRALASSRGGRKLPPHP